VPQHFLVDLKTLAEVLDCFLQTLEADSDRSSVFAWSYDSEVKGLQVTRLVLAAETLAAVMEERQKHQVVVYENGWKNWVLKGTAWLCVANLALLKWF